jgi:hypothetical protein
LRGVVHCDGDAWWYDKFDRYGNLVAQGRLTDRTGRSPSQQLNEPVDQLQRFLTSRGHFVTIRRIVLFTHPRAKRGICKRPTVDLVATSTGGVLEFLNGESAAIDPKQVAELGKLITRDHRFHELGRTLRTRGAP